MLKKRISVLLCLLFVCSVIYIGERAGGEYLATNTGTLPRQIIILDAGHGGYDGGAVASDGTVEKDINLKIAKQTMMFLKLYGFEVIMTRENDVSTDSGGSSGGAFLKREDLENRLKLMKDNPESVFISIHLNKFTTSAANGSQVFYSKDDKSKLLGEFIQKSIVKNLQPENQRVNKQATSSTYLLYNATVPAVLVECGFLSNRAELERLKNSEYQQKMAFCIMSGILDYFSASGV